MTNKNEWTNKQRTLALFSLRFSQYLNKNGILLPSETVQNYFNKWQERYNKGIGIVKAHADKDTLKAINTIEQAEEKLTYSEFMQGE